MNQSVIDSVMNPAKSFINADLYSVKLVVTYSNGTKDSTTTNSFITANQAPSPSFTAPVTSACLQNNQISFTNTTIGVYDSLLWDFGDGTTSTDLNPVHQYTASGSFDVTLIAYGDGCSSASTQYSLVQIFDNPAIVFSADTLVTCNINQTISFTSMANGAVSYWWDFGDGQNSNQPNPTHVYGQPGVFDVTLITTNSHGCSDTSILYDYIAILTNPVPVIVTAGGLNRCVPVYTTFSTNTPNIQSYSWNFGNNTPIWNQPSSLQQDYNNPGNYLITLTATYSNGCSNTNIDTLIARPFTAAYFTSSNNNGCAPAGVTLTHQFPGPGLTYNWQFGDGSTGTSGPAASNTYMNPGTFVPILTVTNSFGCSNTYYGSAINISAVDANFHADVLNGCPPHPVNFTHPGGGLYQYLWNFGDGSTSNLQNPSHTYVNPGSYTVSLNVTDRSGCSDSYTLPNQIQVNNGVNNFQPTDTIYGCVPFVADLLDNSTSSVSWLWSFGDGSNATTQHAVHTYTTPGTYNVSLQTQSNGSSCSQNINPFITYVLSEGYAGFTVSNSICQPYTSTFIDTSSQNVISWFWDFGDGTTDTSQHPVHVYANAGSYNVSLTVTTSSGCTFTVTNNFAANFAPLAAYPTANVQSYVPPEIQFYANSIGASSWLWDFGDGTTSTQQNPFHNYPATGGPFDLTLIISNGTCYDTLFYPASISGGAGSNPNFNGGSNGYGSGPYQLNVPDSIHGCGPFVVNFSNPIANASSILWDFGDGNQSSQFNTMHTYSIPGVYDVKLFANYSNGDRDTIVWPGFVTVFKVVADFNYVTTSACSSSTLVLDNNSIGGSLYNWNFGDGNQSSLFEPNHQYTSNGYNYLITLQVADTNGCSATKTMTYYSSGTNPISSNKRKACAGEVISFSSNNPGFASYLWSFGNGDSSNIENPNYSYTSGGFFTVTLTVVDASQCTTVFTFPYQIEINNPVAAFTFNVTPASCNPPNVSFNNQSTGATSYFWNFGNGQYSALANPQHSLVSYGNHSVTLIAISGSCSDTVTLNNYANRPSILANFTYTQDRICYPISVQYTDLSTDAVSWLWDFGDGNTSTQRNPTHVFHSKPLNPVTLYVWNSVNCMNASSKPNISTMEVSFMHSDSVGCAPYPFQVTGMSSIPASWSWDFGNNQFGSNMNTATATSGTVFHHNGTYQVSVQVTAPTGCVQRIDTLISVVASGPSSSFTLQADSSCAPTIVTFEDTSVGAASWLWNFGNGNQSTLQNPVHVYNVPGTYQVSLVVSDSSGCSDTLNVSNAVEITGTYAHFAASGFSGCAPYQVAFSDSSVNASTYIWDFGDGNTSTDSNPVHVYDQPGVYSVILITYDSTGCSAAYQLADSIRVFGSPLAAFDIDESAGCAPFSISPENLSVGATSYHWNFGDGTNSYDANPNHTYVNSGTYIVSLIAYGDGGCVDTLIGAVPVIVGEQPTGGILATNTSGCAPLQSGFSANITNADSSAVYSWNHNGVIHIGQNLNLLTTQNGLHTITLTVTNQAGCSSTFQSSISVHGADTLDPVVIRSVSVSAPDQIELKWADMIHPELDYYRIYRMDNSNGNYQLVHTFTNTTPVNPDVYQTWYDNGVTTASNTNTYIVQAVNICGLAMPLARHTPHTSINLEVDLSSSTPVLGWNNYGGASTTGYLVQRRDDANSLWLNLAALPANVTSYIDSSVYCSDSVSYRITAMDLNSLPIFDAFSDVEDVMVPGSLLIQRVDMVRSTVEEDSWVLTEWSQPVLAPQLVTGFELFRSTDNLNFTRIAVLPAAQTSYEDRNVSVKSQNYYYRVKVSNACSLEASPGYESSSILLLANPDQRYGVELRWTPYKNWSTGVEEYVIEEWNNQTGTWDYVKTVDGSTTQTGVE
jgi:PKD repeat protein